MSRVYMTIELTLFVGFLTIGLGANAIACEFVRAGDTTTAMIKSMSLRWLGLVPLAIASVASAQAPGEFAQPPPEPYYAPPVVAAQPALPGRLSISLAMQTAGFSDENQNEAQFDGAAIALRYRPWQRVELELYLGGGRQNFQGEEGLYAMGTGTLSARYRFNQERHLNWWLLAGVGATTIARHDASDEEIDAKQRPHGALGIGVEYRWTSFALQLEARAMALGETAEMSPTSEGLYIDGPISGGTLALGASYYFSL